MFNFGPWTLSLRCEFWFEPTKFGTGTTYDKICAILQKGTKLLFHKRFNCINLGWPPHDLPIIILCPLCLNPRWPSCDLPIMTLRIVTLKHMKIETRIMCQNNQDRNVNTVYASGNIKSLFCINYR